MTTDSEEFLKNCLLFDIEVNEKGVTYALGASLDGHVFQSTPGKKVTKNTLEALNQFGATAKYILGHNILDHDVPILQKIYPLLPVLQKPAIDTLYLSPLAFPATPYHRLVKDYQIVRDSINNPLQDAVLAGQIFQEQWHALKKQFQNRSEAPLYYRNFFYKNQNLSGIADALGHMGIPILKDNDLHEAFAWFAKDYCCENALNALIDELDCSSFPYPVLAYVTAWLTVAEKNAVLPPWVRHRFPQISALLHRLRDKPCTDKTCNYCTEYHNPQHFLQNYFGFSHFRSHPQTEDGHSLQQRVVQAAAQNKTLFATLPTGGGKSLCYMLPALMRYQRRNLLTIVISPLQALMKDQVDSFSRLTGTKIAAALYGMLTMPERGEVLEAIRLGTIGILYVSPEQLRNHSFVQAISQREIGAWIFDEAHCLSKWGHDFRPDYIHVIRFIREYAHQQKSVIPPVQCFTATAKKDVQSEIIDIIQSELSLRVTTFEGGHERNNLQYEVYSVNKYEKNQTIFELLQEKFHGEGVVVIYCSTRSRTEKLTQFLQEKGYVVEAFHAGLDISLKKRIQENFIAGDLPVICATNAFGMGIDKDNVRLVIHADIPGSLENYLQEAGRAGRDSKNAECILIFDEQDIEGQFRLSSSSRLTRRDIAQILRGIRFAAKGNEEVVLTPGELLKQHVVDINIEELHDPDTKVKTAIAWLEKAGFLRRNENNTKVFQGKPLVRNLQEAAEKIGALNLSARQHDRWLAIIRALIERQTEGGFSTDELASLSSFSTSEDDVAYQTETQRVLNTLHDMAENGILSKETTLTAYIRYKVSNNAETTLNRVCKIEKEFLKVLEELTPDTHQEVPLELDLRQVNQQLLDREYSYTTPQILNSILYGLSRDGKGLAGQQGSLSLKSIGNNRLTVYLHRDWATLCQTVKIRQHASHIALKTIFSTIPNETKPYKDLKVEFTLEQIIEAFKKDLFFHSQLNKPLAAAERALTFMHELKIVDLQHGLAIFRQAMTLRLNPEAQKRRYTVADFVPLNTHYDERNFQIHVMNEYAHQALTKISAAMQLVGSYFGDDKDDFIKRYFPNKKQTLKRATSDQSYQRIVDDLKNKNQESIVSASSEKNMLVLAGPGSGKTRVVIHRIAYLLRVKRVKASSILVLCFNRSAVTELRIRLRDLVGEEMKYVTTLTFHGLALRLTGRSLSSETNKQIRQEIDFTKVIQDAISLLKGESDILGFENASPREELSKKFSHILLDEYQDIDAEQYELISLLTGKGIEENDQKMTIMAVGDDDQNIYRFRGANIGFIRQFQEDYQANIYYLVQNYRSTANIIFACNNLITHNLDRMKTDHPIQINDAKKMLPHGGNWQINDPLSRGKVQILQVQTLEQQGYAVLNEIKRLQNIEGHIDLNHCAILAREWKELDIVRSALESESLPINLNWGREGGFPSLTRIRENVLLLNYLKTKRTETLRGSSLLHFLPPNASQDNLWQFNLRALLKEWIEETCDSLQPASSIENYLYEALADQRRSKNLGNGIFLSTVHSVKGLEFDHVIILGTNWKTKIDTEIEEERRLYYVAMSRARETLSLFSVNTHVNPHINSLNGDFLHTREIEPYRVSKNLIYKYNLLGMDDLFIDFAGIKPVNHPTRKALRDLQLGAHITFENQNNNIELITKQGVSVGRLSKSAYKKWCTKFKTVQTAKVIALVRRYKDDNADDSFKQRLHGESWEVPLIEIQCSTYNKNEYVRW